MEGLDLWAEDPGLEAAAATSSCALAGGQEGPRADARAGGTVPDRLGGAEVDPCVSLAVEEADVAERCLVLAGVEASRLPGQRRAKWGGSQGMQAR